MAELELLDRGYATITADVVHQIESAEPCGPATVHLAARVVEQPSPAILREPVLGEPPLAVGVDYFQMLLGVPVGFRADVLADVVTGAF